jgi:hypothetical protein
MKLGEAKQRLEQIERYLNDSLITLSVGPLASIGTTLDKCNDILRERQTLINHVQDTEASINLGDETVRTVMSALTSLESKITLIEKIVVRDDLGDAHRQPMFKQLESYRSTRDALRLSLTKCLWEFELVE